MAMESVISRVSHNSLDNFAQLCKIMFTDGTMSRTNIGDMVNFGLGPYYKNKVMKTYSRKSGISKICFDESLNNVSTKKQSDVHITFFGETAKQIKGNYVASEFIRYGDAETVVKAFESVHVHNLA